MDHMITDIGPFATPLVYIGLATCRRAPSSSGQRHPRQMCLYLTTPSTLPDQVWNLVLSL